MTIIYEEQLITIQAAEEQLREFRDRFRPALTSGDAME